MIARKYTLPVLAAFLSLAACDGGTGPTPVDSVIVEAEDSEVAVGGTLQMTATAYDERGNELTGRDVEWSVSSQSIATITDGGLLTGVAAGTVEVTAEIGGKRDRQTVQVVDAFGGCPVATHTLGGTSMGNLSTTDCRFQDGTYVDLYRFTVPAGASRQVTITLRSSAFDAYLVLFDANGNGLAEDDDSAGGNDSRITRTLAPGTYVIAANSYAVSTGAYTLTTQ